MNIWTYSNAISLLRMLLVVPAVWLLSMNENTYAAAIGFLAYATDLLDGWVARRRNEISEAGKIIDPLADKVFVGAVVIALTWLGRLPLWFVSAVIARDILIFCTGIWATKKLGYVLPSNYTGKAAVLMIAAAMMMATLNAGEQWFFPTALAATAMMLISLAGYASRLYTILQQSH